MSVHALVTSIRTNPEPTVLLVLDCLDEVFADLVSRRPGVTMLAHDDLAKLLLIPLVHGIALLLLFFRLSRIGVKILLGRLALYIRVVTELALATLLTVALLEEHAKHGLRIHTKGNLLHLDGLEQLKGILLRLLRRPLLSLPLLLLGCFPLLIGGLAVGCLCL